MAGKGSKKILKYQLFALLFHPLLLENGVTAQEIGMRDGRHSGKYLAALAHIAYDSGLGGYGGIVRYLYMPDYSDLPRYYAVPVLVRRGAQFIPAGYIVPRDGVHLALFIHADGHHRDGDIVPVEVYADGRRSGRPRRYSVLQTL